jgi:tetratricopeptide (TPR) repeat protein
MMIGPLVSPEVKFSKGTEPALTFRTMLTDQDTSRVPSYVDMYLDGIGIPLHLTGFERIPKRELISSIIWNCETLEYDTEFWAKACLRIGNLYALSASRARYLAVDQKDLLELLHKHTGLAQKFYSRSSGFPKLERIAQANSALLGHWMGESEKAVDILEELIANQITPDSVPFVVQGAIVLLETGQMERAKEALSMVPDKLRSPLANRMLSSMGVSQ